MFGGESELENGFEEIKWTWVTLLAARAPTIKLCQFIDSPVMLFGVMLAYFVVSDHLLK